MGKISLVWVFSVWLVLGSASSVLGQDDWKELIGQGGFGTEDALEKAKNAFGGLSSEDDSFDDYFGGGSVPVANDEPSSLADLFDPENNTNSGISPAGATTDSPVGAPEDLPSDSVYDFSPVPVGAPEDSFFSPTGEPLNSPAEAPSTDAPFGAPIYDAPTYAPSEAPANDAPTETPEFAPANAQAETPEFAPTNAPTEPPEFAPSNAPAHAYAPKAKEGDTDDDDDLAPVDAPTGEVDDEFDDDERAPSQAPQSDPADADDDDSDSDAE